MKTITSQNNSEIEAEGWNWGAFVLTFLWAIFNGFWILAILSIIPGVGFIIGIVLGINGNEWAWKKDKYKNYNIFIKKQRRWNMAGGGIIVMFILMFLSMLLFCCYAVYDINYGKTYIKIGQAINAKENIIDLLGYPIKIDSFIGFNVSIPPSNDYGFNVIGSKGCGRIVLVQFKGEMEIVYFAIRLNCKEKIVIVDKFNKFEKNL